ncbi:MAG: SUMF1/EgtB/PvdO family nonheme iron enzyme, partial [Flavobacteriales bacterium]|nr:SUMF1/EgtB/PvdO family nonheme iron enzyme [Flavobacteriales bacterium]
LLEEGHVDRDPEVIFTTEAYLYGGEDYHTAIINDQLKLRVKNKKDVKANDEGRYANMSDGLLLPNYRLPTEAEWELAALGYMGDNLENRKIYPWEGSGVRNSSRQNQGQLLANFKNGRGGNKGTAGKNSDDNYSLTSPVRSYWPNDYGLFDMAGNVSEWVADVYRPITELTTTTDNNPYRGNVFATKKRDSEASPGENPYIIDKQGRVVDTLVDPSDNIYRRNYKRSNNINFLDGDIESQIGGTIDDIEENGSVDNENIVIDKRNKSNGRNESDTLLNNSNEMYNFGETTLVSDRSRVYKGGSWNDRAYWLSPGARRMLDQARSSNTIGFRCAMDRTGADKSDLKANQNRGTDYSKERGN